MPSVFPQKPNVLALIPALADELHPLLFKALE